VPPAHASLCGPDYGHCLLSAWHATRQPDAGRPARRLNAGLRRATPGTYGDARAGHERMLQQTGSTVSVRARCSVDTRCNVWRSSSNASFRCCLMRMVAGAVGRPHLHSDVGVVPYGLAAAPHSAAAGGSRLPRRSVCRKTFATSGSCAFPSAPLLGGRQRPRTAWL
jgi:hypothetical protein